LEPNPRLSAEFDVILSFHCENRRPSGRPDNLSNPSADIESRSDIEGLDGSRGLSKLARGGGGT
jgi:hypothetical protein